MRKPRLPVFAAILTCTFLLASSGMAGSGGEPAAQAVQSKLVHYGAPITLVGPYPEGAYPTGWVLVVRAYYADLAQVRALAAWTEPWEVNREQGYVVVEVTQAGLERLERLGLRVEVDDKLTTLLNRTVQPLAGQVSGIPGFPCYRTVEETYAAAAQMAAAHPGLAAWMDVGDSWEKAAAGGAPGYDLMVLRLTNTAAGGLKPKLFVMGSIHAREFATTELATRFAEHLVGQYGIDPDVTWLLDNHEIHLLLQSNPDGRKQAESGKSWRKNTNENYCGATSDFRGADLNRNFTFQWGCCGGSSGSPCDLTYRGPSASSEPETQTIQNYVRSIFPDQRGELLADPAPLDATGIFLDLHSYGNLVLWPWGFTADDAPNAAGLASLGRKFAFFNGYAPDQATSLYPTDGTTDDFAYGELGLAAYTFEVGTSFFQDCSTFENTILPTNLPALLYAAKSARTPYLTPGGPEALQVTALPSAAYLGQSVQLTAILDDTRFNNSKGAEPVQTVVQAEYYLDVPPWSTSPAPAAVAMVPADGVFSATIEAVQAQIDTSHLSPGRHMLYVRGRDASGTWGQVSAAFLYVLDPLTSPVFSGSVRSAADNAPLAASLQAGPFQVSASPLTGLYSLPVTNGSYTVSASAPGFISAVVEDIPAQDRQVIPLDFALEPVCPLLNDDVESGAGAWTADAPWGITTSYSHSPTHAWTDSPTGNYANNRSLSLTSPALDLRGARGLSLEFWHRYDLEASYDYGRVEYSTDGGASWTQLTAFTGRGQTTWRKESYRLPAMENAANARLRFRLTTDGSTVYDGWYIDDILLTGSSPACFTPAAPTAGFSNSAPAWVGEPVQFIDTSDGSHPLQHLWTFGDGSAPSTGFSPQHTYTRSGVFDVTLVVTNSLGASTLTQPVTVEWPGCTPLTSLELAQTITGTLRTGDPVTYTLGVQPITASLPYTYTVSFGDSSPLLTGSTALNPLSFTHVYGTGRTFTITAEAWNCGPTQRAAASTTTTITSDGIELTPTTASGAGYPGDSLAYTFSLTNTLPLTSTFTVALSGAAWPSTPSNGLLANFAPHETRTFTVTVSIPLNAPPGSADTLLVTVTQASEPPRSITATVVTRTLWRKVYLPVLLR